MKKKTRIEFTVDELDTLLHLLVHGINKMSQNSSTIHDPDLSISNPDIFQKTWQEGNDLWMKFYRASKRLKAQ